MTKRSSGSSRRATRPQRRTQAPAVQLTGSQKRWLLGLSVLALALLTAFSILSANRGSITEAWLNLLRHTFGWGVYVVPVALTLLGLWIIMRETEHPLTWPLPRVIGLLTTFFSLLTLAHHLIPDPVGALAAGAGGGQIGYYLSQTLGRALGWVGATIILVTALGVGIILALDVSLAEVAADMQAMVSQIAAWIKGLRLQQPKETHHELGLPEFRAPSLPEPIPPQGQIIAYPQLKRVPLYPSAQQPAEQQPAEQQPVEEGFRPLEARRSVGEPTELSHWALPSIADILVETDEAEVNLSDIREKTHIIEETLRSLGVPVTVVEVNPGPVVTQFGLEPGYLERRERDGKVKRTKVKVNQISALANDLALALAAAPIRIETPVPGKGVVGLEIPNSETAVVGLRGVMESEQYREIPSRLAVALGRDVSGTAVVDDLAKLPHLLIAGATGSGKSVCINALVACLLFRNTPDDLRMLMVDPKRVELSLYGGIPHLLAPVIVEADRVVGVLTWVTQEMDRRYKEFAKVGARNIQTYNQMVEARGEKKLPFIVVFIDELADLMMVSPEDVERLICRIAQMARATGIHLVIATQRPSVDVVTGLIKANFPARISFAVSSQVDSRVILDVPGADKLLGRGDSLYMAPDSPKLMRVQGCYVSDIELTRLVNFWKGQGAPGSRPAFERDLPEEITGKPSATPMVQSPLWPDMPVPEEEGEGSAEDPLLEEAIAVITKEGRASVSFLQRRLRIGYTRAARLIDTLEAKKIVGPATGSTKLRDVLIGPDREQRADPPQR